MEEKAPAEAPVIEEKKEMTLEGLGKKKKSIFSLFSGCFGGKSQVAEKPVTEEKEEAEDKPTEGEQGEDKKDEPAEDEAAEKSNEEE